MQEFLKVDNLISGYSGGFMLEKINFVIEKGSFTGIIGPNGSGKTTLFKAITGEISVKEGNILFKSTDTSIMSAKQKAQKMAIVTQNTEAADISVEDYVLMGRLPYKKHFQLLDKEIDYTLSTRYMKQVGVFHLKDKLMSELSGGEQQLAAIARALAQEPELLLLDEPTSHLDISHQVQILNLIQQLNEEMHLTVVMIIHDLNLAGEYCDHLIMMNKGKVYKNGNPEQVLNYENIENVYKTVVITQENPLSKKPAIFLVSNKMLNKNKINTATQKQSPENK
ncbi:ABC transporter ATP-binding protein [Bacteroidota bacterium]